MLVNARSLLLLVAAAGGAAAAACVPSDACWPNAAAWAALADSLPSGTLHATVTGDASELYSACFAPGTDAFGISATGDGVCMQYHDCSRRFCAAGQPYDLPAFVVEAVEEADVVAAVSFAAEHGIRVSVKTSGHSYAGSSMAADSLLVWMHNFEKVSASSVLDDFADSCGTVTDKAVRVAGGETWNDVYTALGHDYHIVGGGGLTVSAAGGWLMGGGLSSFTPKYGYGIDNLLQIRVVLADGSAVDADACQNADLFWALRGGGGGTFGVVTRAVYRLYETEPIHVINFGIAYESDEQFFPILDPWLVFWVDLSLDLPRNVGGYWTLSTASLFYHGSTEDAEYVALIASLDAFLDTLTVAQRRQAGYTVTSTNDYWDLRDEGSSTDATGSSSFFIGARLVERSWVAENPARASAMLQHLARTGFFTFNYILGGAATDPAADATAINPAARDALWQIECPTDVEEGIPTAEYMMQFLREMTPDSGSGYNHAAKNEPNWRDAFWGSNLERLQEIKAAVDPDSIFSCWHCVGYADDEGPIAAPRNVDGSRARDAAGNLLCAADTAACDAAADACGQDCACRAEQAACYFALGCNPAPVHDACIAEFWADSACCEAAVPPRDSLPPNMPDEFSMTAEASVTYDDGAPGNSFQVERVLVVAQKSGLRSTTLTTRTRVNGEDLGTFSDVVVADLATGVGYTIRGDECTVGAADRDFIEWTPAGADLFVGTPMFRPGETRQAVFEAGSSQLSEIRILAGLIGDETYAVTAFSEVAEDIAVPAACDTPVEALAGVNEVVTILYETFTSDGCDVVTGSFVHYVGACTNSNQAGISLSNDFEVGGDSFNLQLFAGQGCGGEAFATFPIPCNVCLGRERYTCVDGDFVVGDGDGGDGGDGGDDDDDDDDDGTGGDDDDDDDGTDDDDDGDDDDGTGGDDDDDDNQASTASHPYFSVFSVAVAFALGGHW